MIPNRFPHGLGRSWLLASILLIVPSGLLEAGEILWQHDTGG